MCIKGNKIYDYVIVGSGFGSCIRAMRLAEKGYSVLILEPGKWYDDRDFAQNNGKFANFSGCLPFAALAFYRRTGRIKHPRHNFLQAK
jgi:choline dehydrogenase-like flavoprotein